MNNISIEGTPKTPTVEFNAETGVLELSGRSIPENSIDFYIELLNWIEKYGETTSQKTELNMKLEYFNTASSKCILDVFKKLEGVAKAGKEVTINWFYEMDDEDMLEAGEDYDAIIDINFVMKEVEEF